MSHHVVLTCDRCEVNMTLIQFPRGWDEDKAYEDAARHGWERRPSYDGYGPSDWCPNCLLEEIPEGMDKQQLAHALSEAKEQAADLQHQLSKVRSAIGSPS